jgi:hypothetical protein
MLLPKHDDDEAGLSRTSLRRLKDRETVTVRVLQHRARQVGTIWELTGTDLDRAPRRW